MTKPDRFVGIMEGGGLLAEPEIPNKERWESSAGPDYYPFVRKLGGVSIFDLRDFEPARYARICPNSAWSAFIPADARSRGAVWIEVDVASLGERFISGERLLLRRKLSHSYRNTLMPVLECAALGGVPIASFVSAFLYCSASRETHAIPLKTFSRLAYETLLAAVMV